ncbi:unnamed protein product, partial [Prorocentrum cordatum]
MPGKLIKDHGCPSEGPPEPRQGGRITRLDSHRWHALPGAVVGFQHVLGPAAGRGEPRGAHVAPQRPIRQSGGARPGAGAVVDPEGRDARGAAEGDQDMFTTVTFSEEQQAQFGVDEDGYVQDLAKFDAATADLPPQPMQNQGGSWHPLDNETTYGVIVNRWLLDGGGGFDTMLSDIPYKVVGTARGE